VRLTGKPRGKISFAIINEGYAAEAGDKRWMFDELSTIAELFPGHIDVVNLLALSKKQIKERLLAKDVIYVVGGPTDYVMHVFQKSGVADMLPELLATKVYVGSSAGTMILGKRMGIAAHKQIYLEQDEYGVTAYLGLVDYTFAPHFESTNWQHNTAALLQKISTTYAGRICGLKDTQAVVINGKKTQFVGSKPFCVSAGKIVRL